MGVSGAFSALYKVVPDAVLQFSYRTREEVTLPVCCEVPTRSSPTSLCDSIIKKMITKDERGGGGLVEHRRVWNKTLVSSGKGDKHQTQQGGAPSQGTFSPIVGRQGAGHTSHELVRSQRRHLRDTQWDCSCEMQMGFLVASPDSIVLLWRCLHATCSSCFLWSSCIMVLTVLPALSEVRVRIGR